LDRKAAEARRCQGLEWQRMIDDLDDLSEIEVEQDGRLAANRSGPTIDPICRVVECSAYRCQQGSRRSSAPPSQPELWCLKKYSAGAKALRTKDILNRRKLGLASERCLVSKYCSISEIRLARSHTHSQAKKLVVLVVAVRRGEEHLCIIAAPLQAAFFSPQFGHSTAN
jgi:hypothetical protein